MIFHFLQFPKYTTQPQRKQVEWGRQEETDDLSECGGVKTVQRFQQIGNSDWGRTTPRLGSDQAKALDILRIGSKPDLILKRLALVRPYIPQLTEEEFAMLVSQSVIPHKKYFGGSLPLAFYRTGSSYAFQCAQKQQGNQGQY